MPGLGPVSLGRCKDFHSHNKKAHSGEKRLNGPPVRATGAQNYTATGTLWKVDITISKVWTRGVPSITFAKVFNTSG